MLILNATQTAEQIKEEILRSSPEFSLADLATLSATYRVCWFTFPISERRCRVDILLPGMIQLPELPPSCVVSAPHTAIPIMPLLPTLLHKCLAWEYHRGIQTEHYVMKTANDSREILELLPEAATSSECTAQSGSWLPAWFTENSRNSITSFVAEHPDSAASWVGMGYIAGPPVARQGWSQGWLARSHS